MWVEKSEQDVQWKKIKSEKTEEAKSYTALEVKAGNLDFWTIWQGEMEGLM